MGGHSVRREGGAFFSLLNIDGGMVGEVGLEIGCISRRHVDLDDWRLRK